MAFTKITSSDLNSRGATTLPNQPKISATALKQEFDAPAKEVVAPKVNNLIDELEATSAAASLGATAPTGRTGETVQAVMNKISSDLATLEAGVGQAIEDAHTHDNKELLDTYAQTETDLADAVSKKHEHSNKSLLDTYDQTNSDISDAVSKKHSHSNKDLLDTYTQTESNLADAVSKKHSHDNKALLDTYTQTDTDIADAVDKKHSHSNKSVLDKFGESSGEPTYDGNPIGGGTGDMLASDYDANSTVKNAGGIVSYVASQAYELPTAAADTKGGIKVGSNLSVDDNGVMSATDTTYSEATTSAAGLMSSSDKTKLNGIDDNANNYSLPTASTNTLGGVKVDGSTVTIDSNGVISSSGGGGGTTVVANPTGSATSDLEKLQVGTTIYGIPSITGKADKVTSPTDGHFAGLNSSGNITDSGKSADDFLGQFASLPSAAAALVGKICQYTGADTSSLTNGYHYQCVYESGAYKWVQKDVQPGGGTTVVANPSGTATETLTKLQVGSTIYSVEGGGGTTIVQIPSVSGASFTYNATAQGAAITGLDTTHCTVVGGTGTTVTTSGDTTYVKAINAGSYSFSVKLNDTSSMVWSDLTTADKTYSFTIAKASQTISASPSTVSLDENTQTASVTVSGANTSLSATSSDSNVATASGTSSPITITAVANGSATISIQAQADSNHEASNTVTVSASVALTPTGSTVTPTDSIQTWLQCANIWDKSYTTINEVLADSTTLLALISSNNAVDYMKRSTTWASAVTANSTAMTDIAANNYCKSALLSDNTWANAIGSSTYYATVLNVKVPTLTSDTSYGVASQGGNPDTSYPAWKAFDGIISKDACAIPLGDGTTFTDRDSYIQYQFTSNVCVNKLVLYENCYPTMNKQTLTLKVQGSNNGSNWTDIYTNNSYSVGNESSQYTNVAEPFIVCFGNATKYDYHRLYFSKAPYYYYDSKNSTNRYLNYISEVQFYGYS